MVIIISTRLAVISYCVVLEGELIAFLVLLELITTILLLLLLAVLAVLRSSVGIFNIYVLHPYIRMWHEHSEVTTDFTYKNLGKRKTSRALTFIDLRKAFDLVYHTIIIKKAVKCQE